MQNKAGSRSRAVGLCVFVRVYVQDQLGREGGCPVSPHVGNGYSATAFIREESQQIFVFPSRLLTASAVIVPRVSRMFVKVFDYY